MPSPVEAIRRTVQHNCHVADARHAGDDTLCIYLLKMREFFRWEEGLGYADELPRASLARWLTEREALWSRLEDAEFRPLELDGALLDPFDDHAINARLAPLGLVYSAGYGHRGRPHFFLARLERRDDHDGCTIFTAGCELARDLSAPPAMSRDGMVFLRRESLRRFLWQRVEEWRWQKPDNPMGRAIACYDFDTDLEAALDAMTDRELETVRLHELGEVEAGRLLGEGWRELLARLPRSRTELLARAVRDLLADCLSTLPGLVERGHPASIHFYMANLGGMRGELFPALRAAYEHWRDTGSLSRFAETARRGRDHWLAVARDMLRMDGGTSLEDLIDARRL